MASKKTFETATTELEDIVKKLEQNEISIDESVKLYKKAMELAKFCQEKLEGAKLEIQVATKED